MCGSHKYVAVLDKQGLNKTCRRFKDMHADNFVRASEWNGRLTVVCHEAEGVIGKDKRTNAYITCRIGTSSHNPWKRTKTVKNATTEPDFADEKLTFDITDGNSICTDNDTTLDVRLYDDNGGLGDSLLGSVTVKCREFLTDPGAWAFRLHRRLLCSLMCVAFMALCSHMCMCVTGKVQTQHHQLHVYKFGKGFTLTAKLKLSLSYENGFAGISVFTLVDGRNLANRGGKFDKQDPYPVIKLGKHKKRGKTVDDGGTSPNFNYEQLLIHTPQTAFAEDVQVTLWDDDIGRDDKIGSSTFSILPHIHSCSKYRSKKTAKATPPPVTALSLTASNKTAGELRMSTQVSASRMCVIPLCSPVWVAHSACPPSSFPPGP